MRGHSEHQDLLHDIFMVLLWMFHIEINDIVDTSLLRLIPLFKFCMNIFFPTGTLLRRNYRLINLTFRDCLVFQTPISAKLQGALNLIV
ncbi:hypothetical protein VP01_3260g3 [Puccinia sorghi]|uniref:Uncharacterized protein n=1 Tax=Puccinia sorghi TaxID=27349 RepID=A0A0L6UXW2_9BASI|nr:hypothetical protein VP01_3260g3 [Puccinia sorghi]